MPMYILINAHVYSNKCPCIYEFLPVRLPRSFKGDRPNLERSYHKILTRYVTSLFKAHLPPPHRRAPAMMNLLLKIATGQRVRKKWIISLIHPSLFPRPLLMIIRSSHVGTVTSSVGNY